MSSTMPEQAAAASPVKRSNNRGARRDELLRIASRVFATKGIASATVRDIAQEAGILSGSLYHHFTSKEEMVKEIISPGPTGGVQNHAELIADADDPADGLRACILDAVRWVARKPDVARIFRNDAQYIKETPALADSEQRRQANRLLWVQLVEDGVASGTFRADVDADVVVRAMWDAVLSSTRWFPPLGNRDPEVVGNELATFFLAGVCRPPQTSGRPGATRAATSPRRRTAQVQTA
jgi:TetR/AcrR family transcriptional regulator, cholesterol catabolism regulator